MKHDAIIPQTNFAPVRDFALDCDGVLLDWLGGFIHFAEHVLGRKLDPAGPKEFDLTKWLGCDPDQLKKIITAFNSGEGGYFGRLTPLPGAVEALHAAHAQGRRLSIVTACSTLPAVIAQREQNLRDVFGDIFHAIHAVDLKASKREHLLSFDNVAWVEDNADNAMLGAELGHTTYLIRSSHNVALAETISHPLMTWVDGWDCIRRHEAVA